MSRLIDANSIMRKIADMLKESGNPYLAEKAIALIDLEPTVVDNKCREAVKFKEYFDELYGTGLEVANWHLNGDLISFDSFYEAAVAEN